MDNAPAFQTQASEIKVQKMQFTIINRRPLYINDMLERTKTEVERQLFQVFRKYA